MPELPEVETIKRGLQKIVGQKITKVTILSEKSFQGSSKLVKNKKIVAIKRRAKMLQIDLVGEISLLIHLKMSGQLILEGKTKFIGGHPTTDMFSKMPNAHTRVIFTLSDGSKLFFNDQRRFGWIKVIADDEIKKTVESLYSKLGPEPLEPEFTKDILIRNLLKHKKMPIKVALLDQTVVSGIGNIYACEACFLARVRPERKVETLTQKEFEKIHQGVIKALESGVTHGGSTKTHFVDPEGNKGLFLDYAYVYGREKSSCKICGSEIKKMRLGGRGTFYCPICQK